MSDARSAAQLTAATTDGVRWISLARVASEILLLGSMVVLAHLIAPADFGRFAVAVIVQELAMGIPTEGVGSALVQRDAVRREHLQAGVFLTLAFAAVLAGVTLVLCALIVGPVLGDGTAELVRLSTPMFLLASLGTVPMALLRRRLDFRRLSVIEMVSGAVRALVAVALAALAGLDGSALVLGALAGTAFATALAFAAAPAPLPRLRRQAVRDIAGYGLPASLASISWVGFRNGDYAVISARLGATSAGIYWRAFQLAVEYQRKISVVMYQVAFPVLSRSDSPEEMFALRGRMVRLLTVALFPLIAGLAITAPQIIPWMFGPQWTEAVVPTQILCAAGAATLVIDAVGTTLMATGRPRALLAYGVGHFVVYVSAVVVVAHLGLVAVATAAVVVHTAFLVVAYLMLIPGSPAAALRCFWADIAPASVSCAALVAVATPVGWAVSTAVVPGVVVVAAVTLVAAPAYLLTLRVGFRGAWGDLAKLVGRVLPTGPLLARARRLAPAAARSAT
jgi:O-antigen/teichoic acid export membrane protein